MKMLVTYHECFKSYGNLKFIIKPTFVCKYALFSQARSHIETDSHCLSNTPLNAWVIKEAPKEISCLLPGLICIIVANTFQVVYVVTVTSKVNLEVMCLHRGKGILIHAR